VRVGKILIYVQDRDSLRSCVEAWEQALRCADEAFGPVLPPPAYRRPRGGDS
jgi:hypothetical protein